MTSTALVYREQNTLPGPAEWQGMVGIAETLALSEIVPKAYQGRSHDILAAALLGRNMGLDLMQSMQYVNVIEGKATIAPELMNARLRGAGHRVQVLEWTAELCRIKGTRGDNGDELTVEFTMDDAHRAQLVKTDKPKSAWMAYPKSMLWARALSMLAKALMPDAIIGTRYTPEELGAEVDEDGVPTEPGRPTEALPDHLRAAVEESVVEATDVEVVDETPAPPAPAPQAYAQPAPAPEPTPEEAHAKLAAQLFKNGWPAKGRSGDMKGVDPMKVGDDDLRWMRDNSDVNDEKWGASNAKKVAWIEAELDRRKHIGSEPAKGGEGYAAARTDGTKAREEQDQMQCDFDRKMDDDEPWPANTGDAPPADPNTIPLAQLRDEQKLNQAAAMELAQTMVECGYATDMVHAASLLDDKRDMTAGRARQNIAHMTANRATPA